MSREFGEYGSSGYFHEKIRSALRDLQNEANYEFHKKFIPLFQELHKIAYAISSVEAGDSGLYRSVMETIDKLPKMKKALEELEIYIEPYSDVAREAVTKALKDKVK